MNYVNLVSSFFITGISLFALKPMAGKVGLLDFPGGRKTHSNATPMVGGLGIYLGTLCMCIFTPTVFAEYAFLLTLSAFVLVVGLFDDARDLNVSVRMSLHGFAALAMAIVGGVKLTSLGSLVNETEVIQLGVLSIPITIFAVVGVINAINMSDGIDGLSGCMVLISLFMMAIVSLLAGDSTAFSFIVVLSCSVLAFLTLNFRRPWNKKALIYLGDAGSTMLGFTLAWLFISGTQGPNANIPPVFALWFIAIPLFDTINLLIKRPLNGLSPFSPGMDHLHHNLLKLGLRVEQVVAILSLSSVTMGAIGLIGFYNSVAEHHMFALFLALFLIYCILSAKLSKHVNFTETTV
ncbi:MAG: undecaprenyl-phosphate alpha-N-acetylglucosaminyl 1-phosphate transferase [Nitrospirales bacterium]|nr:MAG: undecaprenyl-phosphate alpha-N-acetylglucosaminyl 1-phosphate transferase [Nitrospirales bacterium]